MEFDANQLEGVTIKGGRLFMLSDPKSILWIGDKYYKISFKVDQHFNWFQKLMWKWCFGVKIEDYKE